ncbi:ribonuclease P protein component [Aquimarina sp. U1-2]|uniref:ribonuclease P protein component n=1 Tax=Aquimarina sp. U1-2 TaxID=2823141 RepID=UPI001AEC938F|nr:ribonuclease P protein component [Aquimarina sp. U1-2]MBP2831123.1 ribonuclease P protein component [Aquimarina sp. U1-2]
MKATFNKKERLKTNKIIEQLFSDGKSIAKYPVRLVYTKTYFEDEIPIKAAVSVSKRNFKKAVDRNRIKRILRESYRKNKYLVPHTTHQFAFMFLYSGKEMPEYEVIVSKIHVILQQFVQKEMSSTPDHKK